MKPPPFEYHRPETLADAVEIMARYGDDARPLAGGQSLMPLLAMRLARPGHIVDLQRVPEMRGISATEGQVRVGAMTRQRELEHDGRLPGLLRAAVPHIGHFQTRNRGTVGGSLSHMDPAAELPAVALVLGAVMVAASVRGRRAVVADDFIVGPQRTALAPDELLVEVVLPARTQAFGFAEATRRGIGDFALAGAACQAEAVAVFGVGPRPQRLRGLEDFLRNGGGPSAEVVALAAAEIMATDDVHSSSGYRRQVAARLVGKVVGQSHISGGSGAWS